MKCKDPPCFFRDRHGVIWITAEGLRRYFGVSVYYKYKFYRYDYYVR